MLESKTETTPGAETNSNEQTKMATEPEKKVKKSLKAPAKNFKPFIPDQEESKPAAQFKPVEDTKAPQSCSLMEELKPAAIPMTRNAVSGSSTSFMPFMPMPQMTPMMGYPMNPMMQQMMPIQMMAPQMVPMMPIQTQMPITMPTVHQPDDYNMMMQQLVSTGMLNINPKIYNQLVPGQELQTDLQMHPGLQEYADGLNEMNQEDLVDYYEEMLMQELANRPEHSFGDHSFHNHTYSDLDEEDFDNFPEDDLHIKENPAMWETDPETAKRREEIRKNFYNPEYKDCECCKGYISNCGSEICKNLGVCHCVLRKQNEEDTETNDNDVIEECKNCTCCQGFIYKCDCVTKERLVSCKCCTT